MLPIETKGNRLVIYKAALKELQNTPEEYRSEGNGLCITLRAIGTKHQFTSLNSVNITVMIDNTYLPNHSTNYSTKTNMPGE